MSFDPIDFDLRCQNLTEYECIIKMKIPNKLLNSIFQKTRKRLMRKKGINVPDNDPGLIEEFQIPANYLKAVKTALNKTMKDIKHQVWKDGIFLTSYEVVDAKYTKNPKNPDKWDVWAKVEGKYADKR